MRRTSARRWKQLLIISDRIQRAALETMIMDPDFDDMSRPALERGTIQTLPSDQWLGIGDQWRPHTHKRALNCYVGQEWSGPPETRIARATRS